MTADIELPPLPERFSYTNSSAHWCYSRYTMVRDDLGAYVRAEDYDALRNASEALRAEVERLQAEVERLKSMTAVTMGIGRGDGNLFVHDDYDSIKVAQSLVSSAERLEKALKDIRSLSSINSAMNPSPLALTVLLGDIHHIADAVLSKEKGND